MNAASFVEVLQKLQRTHGKSLKKTPTQFTPQQLADRWQGEYSVGTLANWRAQKNQLFPRGPAFVKLGGMILYPLEAVELWEAQRLSMFTQGAA